MLSFVIREFQDEILLQVHIALPNIADIAALLTTSAY
jgi:hypothetical protein